jgi:hypothetical protein
LLGFFVGKVICDTFGTMRGIYGKNQQHRVGAEPVALRDVSFGAGMWLGAFVFLGWNIASGLTEGIGKGVEHVLARKK